MSNILIRIIDELPIEQRKLYSSLVLNYILNKQSSGSINVVEIKNLEGYNVINNDVINEIKDIMIELLWKIIKINDNCTKYITIFNIYKEPIASSATIKYTLSEEVMELLNTSDKDEIIKYLENVIKQA